MSSAMSTRSSNSNLDYGENKIKKIPASKVTVGLAKAPEVKNVKSKIGSLNNIQYKPAGGAKKIESQKLNWQTKSRVESLQNAQHKPQGGKVKIATQKLEWNVKSKIGSLDNVKHVPKGGNVKIFDEKYAASGANQHSGRSTPKDNSATDPVEQLLKDTNDKLKLNE